MADQISHPGGAAGLRIKEHTHAPAFEEGDPQPSPWISVSPPRAWKPAKEKQMSVGVLQFIPKSWHMILILIFRMAAGACGHVAKTLASTVVRPHNLGLRCVF